MQYQINAWLEKDNPALEIIDPNKQRVIREFHGDELVELFEQGDIIPDELMSNNPSILDSMVDELLSRFTQSPYNENRIKQRNQSALRGLLNLVEKAKRF